MFTNRLPWVILLLVWMAGSTWWHVCSIKQLCGNDAPVAASPAAAAPENDLPGTAAMDSVSTTKPMPTTPAVAPITAEPAPAGPVTEASLAAKETYTSVFEPINLYFPPGEAYYIKTGETNKFFTEATTYLAAHKDKKLVLTGYTDNVGRDAVNLQLSRDRANSVKVRLRQSGIATQQIRVVAKGEAEPKADNKTVAGRRANRRVTVVVQ